MFRRPTGSTKTQSAITATIENLEDRRLMAASPAVVAGIKIAKRVDTDNTALNSNRITIAFDRSIRLLDATKIRSFGYAADLLNPGQQRKVTVGMTITQDAASPTVLTIITDRLIRKGSRIFIEQGALTDTKSRDIVFDGSTAAKTITFVKGQNKPRYTMSNRNWRPTDLSLFSKTVFSSAPTPGTASVPSNASIRASLVTFMQAKVTLGIITQAKADTAVALYDSIDTTLVPSANMRAALAALTGTVAEPAIDSYLGRSNVTGKPYSFIDFGTISAGATVGETKLSVKNRLQLIINSAFAGEDFRVISAVLGHEALHQDTTASAQGVTPSSQEEEIIANAVQAAVYVQQALVDGSFVSNHTVLINRQNDAILALLNSGDTLFPYGGVLQAPALTSSGNVFIGAKSDPGNFNDTSTVKSFENWLRREYVFRGFNAGGTTSNPTGQAILKNIVGTTGNFSLFGTEVLGFLDNRNQILTDVAYIKMAELLKLTF
jgi:hypothetical protein